MNKLPWSKIALGCGIVSVLVVIRSVITAGRFLYYGGVYWQRELMQDPWLYVGMVAAAVCVAALLVMSDQSDKKGTEETVDDGCEP